MLARTPRLRARSRFTAAARLGLICVLALGASCSATSSADAGHPDTEPPEVCPPWPVPGADAGLLDAGGCVPGSCGSLGVGCGTVGDGCGSVLSCGPCTPLTACTAIQTPGNYLVTQDLVSATTACLVIDDVANVSIRCLDAGIVGYPAISIQNAANVTVFGCTLGSIETPYVEGVSAIGLDGGRISRCVFPISSLLATATNGLVIDQCQFLQTADGVGLAYANQSDVRDNVFVAPQPLLPDGGALVSGSLITTSYGTGNTIEGNDIDGAWPNDAGVGPGAAGSGTLIGVDDGIILWNESSDVIRNNRIRNVFDMGIETVKTVQDTVFAGNQIDSAGNGGIGGWWWMSLAGSTLSGNVVTHSGSLFVFNRYCGLPPGQADVELLNNVFQGNVYAEPPTGAFMSAYIVATDDLGFEEWPGTAQGGMNCGTDDTPPDAGQFLIGNNHFQGNDFGHQVPLFLGPPPEDGGSTGIVDDGCNRCLPGGYLGAQSPFPLDCQ
ncbi:MAG TPA: right-handed parallel beta-helix repeat-containing protein [Myxococcales bacterium]|nr:right-handed parallel beta-helix repeat-containing protein [Myxococcales bacterium]